jgi:hypothetical protein
MTNIQYYTLMIWICIIAINTEEDKYVKLFPCIIGLCYSLLIICELFN